MAVIVCSTSCKAVRTYTTTATAISRGDTATIITTKTTEEYDGAVKSRGM